MSSWFIVELTSEHVPDGVAPILTYPLLVSIPEPKNDVSLIPTPVTLTLLTELNRIADIIDPRFLAVLSEQTSVSITEPLTKVEVNSEVTKVEII